MNLTAQFIAGLGLTFSAAAGNYTLTPAVIGMGGVHGRSAHYSAVRSSGPGGSGASGSYTARTGFPAMLPDPVHVAITAPSAQVNETAALQLTATELYEDATQALLGPESAYWSVLSGPASISPAGLLSAGTVYESTAATVTAAGTSLTLSIQDTDPDNFDAYAGDRLPDDWQVQYFGIHSLEGGQHDDFDHDGTGNLLEFAFGTNPASSASGPQSLQYAGTFAGGGAIVQTGTPVPLLEPSARGVDRRGLFVRRRDYAAVGLSYIPQFSVDLEQWVDSSAVPTVLADDGAWQIVSVPYLNFISGKKVRFFRMKVTFTP